MDDYKTSDLALAAFLTYKGFLIKEVSNDERHHSKKLFIFARKPGTKIEAIEAEYFSGKALVDPRKYHDEIKAIKNRIYS